jgi:acyl-CoA thioesterase-1
MKNNIHIPTGKIISAFILSLGLAVSLTACGDESKKKTTSSDSAVIVCLGDSLTKGMSATTVGADDESHSYPTYFSSKVNATVINAGVSGDTAAMGLARVQTDVIAKNPDIVVICLGANDFLDCLSSSPTLTSLTTSINTMKANLKSIITALDTEERLIYVAKFYTATSAKSMLSAKAGITDTATQNQIIALCDSAFSEIESMTTSKAEVTLISDIWTGVWGVSANMSSDGIHPTAAGYQVMADNYFNAMKTDLTSYGLVK